MLPSNPTYTSKQQDKVLIAWSCDLEGAVHQRRQAQQHTLLSMSETPPICIKPLHTPSGVCALSSLSTSFPFNAHRVCCVCRKLELMTDSVLCVLTQLPPGHTLSTQQKTHVVLLSSCIYASFSLCLFLSISLLSSPSGEYSCFAALCCIYYLLYIFSWGLTTDIWVQK